MSERKIVSIHLIADHDFIHHSISATCKCKPEQIAKNVWKHQSSVKYRSYTLFEDGKFDCIIPDEKIEIE
jgi:hypothetical protein